VREVLDMDAEQAATGATPPARWTRPRAAERKSHDGARIAMAQQV
jgi:hypothetical protein